MKKIISILSFLFISAMARAMTPVYTGPFVSSTGLSYSTTPVLDLMSRQIDYLSTQVVYSSAQISNVTFTDGIPASGTFTVVSTNSLTAAKATDKITIVSTTGLSGATLTITNSPAGASKVLAFDTDWYGASTVTAAVSLASAIDALNGITASASGGVVYATAEANGSFYNAIGVVSSTPSAMSVNSANFTGGADTAYIAINGVPVNFTSVGTTSGTASAISTAINATAGLSGVVSSTWSSNVVYTTATAVGSTTNYSLYSSNSSSITVSGSAMTGGTDPAWTLNSAVITKANHRLPLGYPVLYSTGTVAIGGLTNQTTYYAIPLTANTFELANTSTNAVAGTPIVLTSTSSTGGHTYTLAPLAISGSASWKWQSSNDATNWYDLPSISSTTFSTPYTASNTMSDGIINFRYLRFNFTAPTTGGVNISIPMLGKNTN